MMRRNLVELFAVSVVMVMGGTASAEVINTYNGPITVTPGTVAYGEVGTLLNAGQMNGVGFNTQYWNPPGNPGVQVAGSTLDHYWVQSATNEIKWSLTTPVSAVLGFPGTDHGPLPMENLEYKMWGSNDLTNWYVGTLTAIYHDGWDPTPPPGATDDWYATRWDFSNSYQYFKTVGTPGVVVGWYDYDPEMDGIAAVAIPAPGAMLLSAIGLLGLGGWRVRDKTT
jgi:hypothetical protein